MIVVVRHGRTASNASGLLLGRADPPLDDVGRDQAGRLAVALGRVDRVVSSPLGRARQTAAAIAEGSGGAEVEVDERFVELDYGAWDQRPVADVTAEEWARWRADVTWAPPGGESLVDLGRRVRDGLGSLAAEATEGTVVVVTHVSPVKAAVAWALGVGDEVSWRCFVAPASVTRIAVGPAGRTGVGAGRPSLVSFNEVHHLADPDH